MVTLDGAYTPRRQLSHGPNFVHLGRLGVRAAEFRMKYHIPLNTRARNTVALQEAIDNYSYSRSWSEEEERLSACFSQWAFIARNWGYEVTGLIEAAAEAQGDPGLKERYQSDFQKLDKRFSKFREKLQEHRELKRLITMHMRSLGGEDPAVMEEEYTPRSLEKLLKPLMRAEDRFFDKPTEKRLWGYLSMAEELVESKEYVRLVKKLDEKGEFDFDPKLQTTLRGKLISTSIMEGLGG